MTQRKVAVFGLDGITFDLLQPWLDEGRLPNLARLLAEGASGRLRSTIPPSRLRPGLPSPPAPTPANTA